MARHFERSEKSLEPINVHFSKRLVLFSIRSLGVLDKALLDYGLRDKKGV